MKTVLPELLDAVYALNLDMNRLPDRGFGPWDIYPWLVALRSASDRVADAVTPWRLP